jgi:hypothetical protein
MDDCVGQAPARTAELARRGEPLNRLRACFVGAVIHGCAIGRLKPAVAGISAACQAIAGATRTHPQERLQPPPQTGVYGDGIGDASPSARKWRGRFDALLVVHCSEVRWLSSMPLRKKAHETRASALASAIGITKY